MAQGEFLWCDLATFDVDKTLAYYQERFGWDFKSEEFSDASTYYYASGKGDVTAGIYEMPNEYRQSGMPSFWMSYIGVDDITGACEQIEALGGSVVLGPASFGRGAAIALIEDPQGARFTLFTGSYLQPRSTKMISGSHYWNELYTPDLEGAREFYGALFGWKVQAPDGKGRSLVENLAGSPTTVFQDNNAAPAPLDSPQWTVSFATDQLDKLVEDLPVAKREQLIWIKNGQSAAICLTDPNGAAYVVAQVISEAGWFG